MVALYIYIPQHASFACRSCVTRIKPAARFPVLCRGFDAVINEDQDTRAAGQLHPRPPPSPRCWSDSAAPPFFLAGTSPGHRKGRKTKCRTDRSQPNGRWCRKTTVMSCDGLRRVPVGGSRPLVGLHVCCESFRKGYCVGNHSNVWLPLRNLTCSGKEAK